MLPAMSRREAAPQDAACLFHFPSAQFSESLIDYLALELEIFEAYRKLRYDEIAG